MLAIVLWGPFWLILGLLLRPPGLYVALTIMGAPFIFFPLAFAYRMLREADETARRFIICFIIVLIMGAISISMGW